MKDTLFLHMGPGLNAHVERKVLSSKYNNIHFWDQPYIFEEKGAFLRLVDSAVEEIRSLSKSAQFPIHLMAHSFGGHLVGPILNRVPELVSDVEMVSTGYHLPRGFAGLLERMGRDPLASTSMKNEILDFFSRDISEEDLKNHIWDMLSIVAKDPKFMRYYWPRPIEFEKYSTIAQSGPALDMGTFQLVVNDFIKNHFGLESVFRGRHPIRIRLGDLDPLLDLEKEIKDWSKIYPAASIVKVVGSGHYIHLEGNL